MTEATLLNYLKLYNHHFAQRAIDSKAPIIALKEWQKKRPELLLNAFMIRRELTLPLNVEPVAFKA